MSNISTIEALFATCLSLGIVSGVFWIGDSNFNYGMKRGYALGRQESKPVKIYSDDLNGDGIKDIVVRDLKGTNYFFLGDSNGNYSPWKTNKVSLEVKR